MIPWVELRARQMFLRSLAGLQGGYLELVCPDRNYTFGDPAAALRAMVVIHRERFFLRALVGADVGIGESYMDGDWSSPDLVALVRLAVRNLRLVDSSHTYLKAFRRLVGRLRHRLRSNTVRGSRENIRAHYDLGNEFYKLFLDSRMQYSCAYFRNAHDTLERAQQGKLQRICAKLNLRPGDRILEIGCGWGAFAIHAARYFGARVSAVTISKEQYDYVTALLAASDLGEGSVHVLLQDYRGLQGQFDKIVSIEMFEAVGLAHYDDFFGVCDRLLAPDGAMLLQTITLAEKELASYRSRVDWIQRYIFPGSELASVAEILRSLGRATSLGLLHAESLGLHYARTLEIWRENFFRNLGAVESLGFDERFQRMWDFYLAWCEGGFRERYISVMQLVMGKSGARSFLIGDPPEETPSSTESHSTAG